jgi:DNA-directed RNA polymerase specialized sigma24 family protein
MDIILDLRNKHSEYMKLKKEYNHFLQVRLKARIKLRFSLQNFQDRKRVEKNVEKNIIESWDVSWSLINSMKEDKEFQSWLFDINLNLLLFKMIRKKNSSHSEQASQGMVELYRMYRLPIRSYVASRLYGKKGTEYFNNRCEDITMTTFQKFEKYADRYNPYKGSMFSYLVTIAENRVKDEKTLPENLVGEFNERDEDDNTPAVWAVSSDLSPDKAEEKYNFETFVLKTMIEEGGYPWQTLVVLLTKTCSDREDIVQDSDKILYELFDKTRDEIMISSFHEDDEIKALFMPLEEKLSMKLSEIIPTRDHRSRDILSDYLNTTLGEIELGKFFSKDPLKNIRDWNHRLFKRVRKTILSEME